MGISKGFKNSVLSHDDAYNVKTASSLPDGRRGRRDAASIEFSPGLSNLLTALKKSGLDCEEQFEVAPAGRRATKAPAPTVKVPVGPGQLAMILVEAGGVYEWVLPDEAAGGGVERRSSGRHLMFRLETPDPRPDAKRRGQILDWAVDKLVAPVRVIVVRFAARKVIDFARERLEESISPGLVPMNGGADTWTLGEIAPLNFPKRVLLFIHGTFSTTMGSFGALDGTTAGKAFLSGARARYDSIVGYDHYSLREAPGDNARALLDTVAKLGWDANTQVDIVAYSRGGLVARCLVEDLLPSGKWPFQVGRVVFVACTNGGTTLADPGNWKTLLDLYTNLAVAAGQGLGALLPGLAGTVVIEGIRTLGAFAEAVVDTAINEGAVPGIAAMSPRSAMVRALNAPMAKKPKAGIRYNTIGSEFSAIKFGDRVGERPSLPTALMHRLSDLLADRLMGKKNDLVVNGDAMVDFGGYGNRLSKDGSVVWESNPVVHHLNYFQQPGVAEALSHWLLDKNADALPLVVDNPQVIDAGNTVAQIVKILTERELEHPVVLRRSSSLFYPRTVASILAALIGKDSDVPLADAIGLRESDAAIRASAIVAMPLTVNMNGWVQVIGDVVRSAILPPLAIETGIAIESAVASGNTPRRSRGLTPDSPLIAISVPDPEPAERRMGAAAPKRRSAPGVECHFAAEMPPSIIVAKPTTLTVIVSPKEIVGAMDTAKATVDPARAITIEIQAVKNCAVIGNAVEEIDLPNEETAYDFKVAGASSGQAEIWVDARQGARRLVRLVLQPTVNRLEKLTAASEFDSGKEDLPMVSLRIHEVPVGEAGRFKLHFSMESRELDGGRGVAIQVDTQPLNDTREDILRSFYKFLEGNWGKNAKEREGFESKLRANGALLYNHLVPQKLREAIRKHRNQIGSIEVISSEPHIPWEMLFIVEPEGAIDTKQGRFLAELGLMRWLPNHGFPPSSLEISAGRARHVVPDYDDNAYHLPHAVQERQLLKDLFDSQEVPDGSDGLLSLIGDGDFDLLHFGCHGEASENEIWNASLLVDPDATRTLNATEVEGYANLRHEGRARPIVFLNACQTGKSGRSLIGTGGMAEAFVRRGAGLFVGTQWSIADGTALDFANEFYRALQSGKSVVQATLTARRVAKDKGDPTWLAYTVYGHPYGRLQK